MTTEVKATSWIKEVLAKLNMNEEGKVGLMHKTLVKSLKKQIDIRKKAIVALEIQTAEKIEEMEEVLTEIREDAEAAFITVDVSRITDVPSRKDYFTTLNYNFDLALDRIEKQEQSIKDLKAQTKATIEAKEKEIARFELKLSKVA